MEKTKAQKTEVLRFRVTETEKKRFIELIDSINHSQAQTQKINRNQFLQAMLRNSIDLGPDFLAPELQALNETNRALLGIGRNINQVVKKINAGQVGADDLTENYLKTIAAYITQSRNQIKEIIQRNQKRAQTDYKDIEKIPTSGFFEKSETVKK